MPRGTRAPSAFGWAGRFRFYSNTNGSPSAKITDVMITLTKPTLRKGWRSTSVMRNRKPTPEFIRSSTRETSTEAA